MKTLVGRLTRNENFGSRTVFYSSFFLRFILFKETLNCHLWNFYGVILQKNFESEFCNQFWFFKKTQFYLKTWWVVKLLIQHLTSCKKFHQQNDELWKRWLEDSLVLKVLVQKLFSILVFFLRFILFKEALNCHLWKFYGANLQKKNSKASFATEFDFMKTHFYLKTWCFVKKLIQHLTRCKSFHSKTDELWKCWLEDSLVMKTLVQKLFSKPVFFQFHSI